MRTVTLPRADRPDGVLDIDTLHTTGHVLTWLADHGFRPHALDLGDRLGVLFDDGRPRGAWGLIELTDGGMFLRASMDDNGNALRYDAATGGTRALSALSADLTFTLTVSGGTVAQ